MTMASLTARFYLAGRSLDLTVNSHSFLPKKQYENIYGDKFGILVPNFDEIFEIKWITVIRLLTIMSAQIKGFLRMDHSMALTCARAKMSKRKKNDFHMPKRTGKNLNDLKAKSGKFPATHINDSYSMNHTV